MNTARRKSLRTAIEMISRAITCVEAARDEESDSLGNMPENLEGSERYMKMEEAIDHLDDAIGNLEEARTEIEASME